LRPWGIVVKIANESVYIMGVSTLLEILGNESQLEVATIPFVVSTLLEILDRGVFHPR